MKTCVQVFDLAWALCETYQLLQTDSDVNHTETSLDVGLHLINYFALQDVVDEMPVFCVALVYCLRLDAILKAVETGANHFPFLMNCIDAIANAFWTRFSSRSASMQADYSLNAP